VLRRRTAELQLAQAVQERNTLVLGRDVYEVDAWGIDMYTRRNIFDGACAATCAIELHVCALCWTCHVVLAVRAPSVEHGSSY